MASIFFSSRDPDKKQRWVKSMAMIPSVSFSLWDPDKKQRNSYQSVCVVQISIVRQRGDRFQPQCTKAVYPAVSDFNILPSSSRPPDQRDHQIPIINWTMAYRPVGTALVQSFTFDQSVHLVDIHRGHVSFFAFVPIACDCFHSTCSVRRTSYRSYKCDRVYGGFGAT